MSGRTGTATRGRIDKRAAILDAAFTVFARDGYAQACVRDVAAEAGVAKPTVYNHLRDKESLFRAAVAAVAEDVLVESVAQVATLTVDAVRERGLAAVLTEIGGRLLVDYTAERSTALRGVLRAELGRFAGLLGDGGPDRLTEALADRLARLSLAGTLRNGDPVIAAEQFLALLTGPVDVRSMWGTRMVPDHEIDAVVAAAVATFIIAYAPGLAGDVQGALSHVRGGSNR